MPDIFNNFKMLSEDSGRGESTPRRVQKRLFGPSGSSTKRSLFAVQKINPDGGASEEESDLGPISPLALTDQSPSSDASSSDRQFESPLGTPETTPRSHSIASWDRLLPSNNTNTSNNSLFPVLKRLTRAARSSPRRKIFPESPKSRTITPHKKSNSQSITPNHIQQTLLSDDIIPDTPHKSLYGPEDDDDIVAETPHKDSPEQRLITPLGSVSKDIPLPRLHRRKSLNPLDTNEGSSPERKENVLKRHSHDILSTAAIKLLKSEENSTIPRARASLFQEVKKEDFKLSTKSFYSNSCERPKREYHFSMEWRDSERNNKKRSLSLHVGGHKRSAKRRKVGEINAGVSHGIKRPKPKRHVSRSEAFKKEKQEILPEIDNIENSSPVEAIRFTKPSENTKKEVKERVSSPEVNPNKKFFKTKKTMEPNRIATVTVNSKNKLKISNGRSPLNQRKSRYHGNVNKKPKLADVTFDATDLAFDDPKFDASMEHEIVNNILKTLEDDWADDDYDTMEPLIREDAQNVLSPTKSMNMRKDVMMSPASELSNMTSIMNIEDVAVPTDLENILNNNNAAKSEESTSDVKNVEKKYFPLFTKGYTTNNLFEDFNAKGNRGVKRSAAWQMTIKGGGDENQYQLDAGQKKFGATCCTECGIVYQIGDAEDENAHLNYHNSVKTLKFPGWKKERIVSEDPFTSSRIILIEPNDSKQCWKKVSDILQVVDRDLGLTDVKVTDYQNKKIYIYVRDKNILGVLVAEYIKIAHRMIPELIELDCCSAETTPVKCGINVVWTAMSHRRQGIAKKLVDTVRANFHFGYVMSVDDIAFSMPTPSGKIFAEKYTKTQNFKVYN
ncbi:N-acetyltransferase ESCO2 [Cephus cinctus]|uniref:N-acetyltransferase ESCO2 n=1 Tax=Cephus cinctus TaxID=211228 RepID=A0AAJ7W6N6_CEPCN|nr:N-acetyltransferase ESCO2 [Cephus cinctus]XP_024946578.1 N-acetyltransferase ESCO2 [Cephus cinctus]